MVPGVTRACVDTSRRRRGARATNTARVCCTEINNVAERAHPSRSAAAHVAIDGVDARRAIGALVANAVINVGGAPGASEPQRAHASRAVKVVNAHFIRLARVGRALPGSAGASAINTRAERAHHVGGEGASVVRHVVNAAHQRDRCCCRQVEGYTDRRWDAAHIDLARNRKDRGDARQRRRYRRGEAHGALVEGDIDGALAAYHRHRVPITIVDRK
mmetsp:Transcript_8896/g.26889  ORF Transcript_8896/g.26889 Transcript_8896/m.26889 type:complete len:217 (-) Transcript_8896:1048-1698(-)